MYKLAIVVPCYKEEEVLEICSEALRGVLNDLAAKGKITEDSFVMFVNDGSKDRTWELIESEHAKHPVQVKGVNLAGNVGHQYALTAGLLVAKDMCDISISIDADLQDDVAVIEDMVDAYYAGNDIVYGVRNDRSTDTFFKRATAQGFYKFMEVMGVKTVYNHADFRLMSRRALAALMTYPERNTFLRGMVRTLGFAEDTVLYDRGERFAGESKYPLRKMLAFALDGITSFSVRPLSLIVWIGLLIILLAIAAVVYALVQHALGNTLPGWTSLLISIWFVGGAMLTSLGVIGIYVGKIYSEVKQRPRYIVWEEC